MSINWVMLDSSKRLVRLEEETIIYTSPPRTGLLLETPRTYPGNSPVSFSSNTGTIYLTNQRVVYLPATPTPKFQSFSSPLNRLHDSRVTAPLFGPNVWQAIVQPVSDGGLPRDNNHIVLSLTFRDGGAYDFQSSFERIKERFMQALQNARDSRTGTTPSTHQQPNVNLNDVHLDELPTYQDSGNDEIAPQPAPPARQQPPTWDPDPAPLFQDVVEGRTETRPASQQPSDAPPGYEEAQRQSVLDEMGSRQTKGGD